MAKATNHPVLGRLIPDQLGEELLFYRKFPAMKVFWHPNSKKQLEDLEPKHRELVKKWDQQPGELPQYSSNFDVLAALQSLGVFEVGISQVEGSENDLPTAAQISAWEHFTQHEEQVCRNAQDAVVRYFRSVRAAEPELFDGEDDCPEVVESIEDLVACVRFDGMNLNADSIAGVATISFGWDVDWDMEHGLQMLLFDGQVIAMGNALYGPEDVLSELNFFRECFVDEEQSAYNRFAAAFSE